MLEFDQFDQSANEEEVNVGDILIVAADLLPIVSVAPGLDVASAAEWAFSNLKPRKQKVLTENLGLNGLDGRSLSVVAKNLPRLDKAGGIGVSKSKAGEVKLEALTEIRRQIVGLLNTDEYEAFGPLLAKTQWSPRE